VVFVAFEDALKYSEWAGSDLPTEAEWLYACRAGSTQRYYWGDDFDGSYAWYRGNTRALGPRPVGRKRPNPWGLYDLVGNAREYCRVGPTGWWPRGSSWARCESYLTRQGTRAENLMAEGLELRLQVFEAAPQYPPYPYDDDRGFRCIIRAPQPAAGTR
jgi:formylglycine-generating enzyme required for sulfatase activity